MCVPIYACLKLSLLEFVTENYLYNQILKLFCGGEMMVDANLLVTHEPSHAGSAKEEVEKALIAIIQFILKVIQKSLQKE